MKGQTCLADDVKVGGHHPGLNAAVKAPAWPWSPACCRNSARRPCGHRLRSRSTRRATRCRTENGNKRLLTGTIRSNHHRGGRFGPRTKAVDAAGVGADQQMSIGHGQTGGRNQPAGATAGCNAKRSLSPRREHEGNMNGSIAKINLKLNFAAVAKLFAPEDYPTRLRIGLVGIVQPVLQEHG